MKTSKPQTAKLISTKYNSHQDLRQYAILNLIESLVEHVLAFLTDSGDLSK